MATRRLTFFAILVVSTLTVLSGCHHRHFCRAHRPLLRPCLLPPVCDPCCEPACDPCFKPDLPVSISPPVVDPLAPAPGWAAPPGVPVRPLPPQIEETPPPPMGNNGRG